MNPQSWHAILSLGRLDICIWLHWKEWGRWYTNNQYGWNVAFGPFQIVWEKF